LRACGVYSGRYRTDHRTRYPPRRTANENDETSRMFLRAPLEDRPVSDGMGEAMVVVKLGVEIVRGPTGSASLIMLQPMRVSVGQD
jgi:hypothetical protein